MIFSLFKLNLNILIFYTNSVKVIYDSKKYNTRKSNFMGTSQNHNETVYNSIMFW